MADTQLRIAAVGSVAFALASCAPAPGPAFIRPPPGWECRVDAGSEDELYFARELNADGTKRNDFMRWEPRVGSGMTIKAEWAGGIPEPTLPIGRVSIDWLGSKGSEKERGKLLLQMTTHISKMPIPSIVSQDVKNPYDRSLVVSWGDITALARGAKDLFLVLKDRRGALVDQTRVDPEIFGRGEQKIARAKERIEVMAADYQNQCEREPQAGGEIIVH